MKKFFIGLSIAAIWLLIPIIFYLVGFKLTFLSPDFYKEELIENNFYTESTDLIIESLVPDTGESEFVDVQEVMTGAITPFWLQVQMEAIIDTLFLLLEKDAQISEIDLIIDFSGPHNAVDIMITDNIEEQLEIIPIFSSLVSDSAYDEAAQTLNPVPEKIHALAIINELASTSGESEDSGTVDFEKLGTKPEVLENERLQEWQETLEVVQTVYLWVSFILIGSIALAAILILISLLLVKKNLVSMVKLLSNTFLIPGIIGVTSLGLQKILFGIYKDDLFSGQVTSALAGTNLLSNLVNSMVQSFINFMLWPFGICLAIGVILLIAAFIIKKYNKAGN